MNRLRASRRSESLLLAFLLWTAPLASGCGSWRAGRFADLPDHSSEGEELLVITGNRAFHLRATSVDATGIRGTALRTWTLSGGRVDVADVAYFLETNDSPERVAAHLGWQEFDDPPAGAPLSIEQSEVRQVRAYRPDPVRTVGAVAGVLLLAAVIGAVVLMSAISAR